MVTLALATYNHVQGDMRKSAWDAPALPHFAALESVLDVPLWHGVQVHAVEMVYNSCIV